MLPYGLVPLSTRFVFEILVYVQRVEILGIETGEKHVNNNRDVDLLCCCIVCIRPLLVLDTLLHVLIVEIELRDGVVGAVAVIVFNKNCFERCLLLLGLDLIVLPFLLEVLSKLFNVLLTIWIFRELRRR